MFSQWFNEWEFPAARGWNGSGLWAECSEEFAPRVDITEDEGAVSLHVELPGLDKDEVAVNFEDGVLTVSGERKPRETGEKGSYRHVERAYGRFRRSFHLSEHLDPAGITAAMDKGVLTIRLPRREESKPRRIEVAVN